MTDAELQEWWPDLGAVVAELRGADRAAVADLLVDAVAAGVSSSEILGGVGVVLREHRALRSRLSASGASAWDEVLADVHRAYPVRTLADRLARLGRGRPRE